MKVVDVFSIGASISTMIGLIVAIVSLWNYYREKRVKLEYDVKKDFFDGIDWECIGDNKGLGSFSFRLNKAPFLEFQERLNTSKLLMLKSII